MKKLLAIALSLLMVLALAACGGAPAGEPAAEGSYEIAMITDIGNIDDKSFNQGTWEGCKEYAEANGNITHQYYKPTEQSDDAYIAAIDLAIQGGAKVVVTPGFLFLNAITACQEKYPDVNFVFIDADGGFQPASNAVGITYAEQESGYLAGYAVVKDGMTKLGFMGGMAVPAVVRYGYGFVQGANDAAAELGVSAEIKYFYTGGFEATPEAQALAASWYQEGTEVIFGCGGTVGLSVFAAAEAAGAKGIGVDVDQSGDSATVITSAMKGLKESVNLVLGQHFAGSFPGGEMQVLGAAQNAVALPMASSKFDSFSQADYDAIYAALVAGEVAIPTDADGGSDGDPNSIAAGFANATVDFVTQ